MISESNTKDCSMRRMEYFSD